MAGGFNKEYAVPNTTVGFDMDSFDEGHMDTNRSMQPQHGLPSYGSEYWNGSNGLSYGPHGYGGYGAPAAAYGETSSITGAGYGNSIGFVPRNSWDTPAPSVHGNLNYESGAAQSGYSVHAAAPSGYGYPSYGRGSPHDSGHSVPGAAPTAYGYPNYGSGAPHDSGYLVPGAAPSAYGNLGYGRGDVHSGYSVPGAALGGGAYGYPSYGTGFSHSGHATPSGYANPGYGHGATHSGYSVSVPGAAPSGYKYPSYGSGVAHSGYSVPRAPPVAYGNPNYGSSAAQTEYIVPAAGPSNFENPSYGSGAPHDGGYSVPSAPPLAQPSPSDGENTSPPAQSPSDGGAPHEGGSPHDGGRAPPTAQSSSGNIEQDLDMLYPGVWWDINTCPVPDGHDPGRVRQSIETVLKKKYRGLDSPVTIFCVGNLEFISPQVLKEISSSGILLRHTPFRGKSVLSFLREWKELNPPSYTIMLISGDSSWYDDSFLSLGYTILRAFPNSWPVVPSSKEWHWENLLKENSDSEPSVETNNHTLKNEPALFCTLCKTPSQSCDDFIKHLKSAEHIKELGKRVPRRRVHEQADDEPVFLCKICDCPAYDLHNMTIHFYSEEHELREWACATSVCVPQNLVASELHEYISTSLRKRVNPYVYKE